MKPRSAGYVRRWGLAATRPVAFYPFVMWYRGAGVAGVYIMDGTGSAHLAAFVSRMLGMRVAFKIARMLGWHPFQGPLRLA